MLDYIVMQYLDKILNMPPSSKGMPSGNPDGSLKKYTVKNYTAKMKRRNALTNRRPFSNLEGKWEVKKVLVRVTARSLLCHIFQRLKGVFKMKKKYNIYISL